MATRIYRFRLTRNGIPVGELKPIGRLRFVDRERLQRLFAQIPPRTSTTSAGTWTAASIRIRRPVPDAAGLLDTSVPIALGHLVASELPEQGAIASLTLAELAAHGAGARWI